MIDDGDDEKRMNNSNNDDDDDDNDTGMMMNLTLDNKIVHNENQNLFFFVLFGSQRLITIYMVLYGIMPFNYYKVLDNRHNIVFQQ